MRPISFTCNATLDVPPSAIFEEIKTPASWQTFTGYGFLPGIRKATFEVENDPFTGSLIRVENTDGSGHVEEILKWIPNELIEMELREFSPPLTHFATHFIERWRFSEDGREAERVFFLYPKNIFTKPLLRLISIPLKKAVAHHLKMIASGKVAAK